ncbi:MAG: O-antigen ligase family protein [Clostridia bacterium]|nr:O-antigen ligase family protein [Clostridia bacterium]
MTAKKLRGCLEHAYMLAVCAFLLWDIPYMTEAQWTFDVRGAFPAVWYGLAVMMLVLSRLRLGALWLPAGLLAWMTASSAYAGVHVLSAQTGALANGVLAFLVILPAPCIVERRRMMAWLRFLLAAWTAAFTAQALIGLWAAVTGHAVFSLKGTWYIGVNLGDNRLYLMAYVTTAAVKLGLSAVLAVTGAASARGKAGRAAYLLCALTMLLCLSLTDCRTAFIAVGAALGMMAFVWILHRGGQGTSCPPRMLRVCCALTAAVVLTVGTYGVLTRLLTAIGPCVQRELNNINILELPGELLPSAAAEAEHAVQHRALEADNLFNDRQLIWSAAVRLLEEHPGFLLTGTTAVHASALTNLYVDEAVPLTFAHVHNIYLLTLVSWGIPGFLLLAAALLAFLRAAWRVMLRRPMPLRWRLAPVPALYVLLCETVDCYTRLEAGTPMLLYACLFAGWTLALDRGEATQ